MSEIIAGDGDKIKIRLSANHSLTIPLEVTVLPTPATIWNRDICSELSRNENCAGLLAGGWWQRTLAQIDGITIHHTLSYSPHAAASHYVKKGDGRPSIPYHLWITQTGEALYCLGLLEGCWHDHTGHRNTHISVGLAGSLHVYEPPDAQLDTAAKVARWAIAHSKMNVTRESVKGHCDYIATVCPGWTSTLSGKWRERFYTRLEELQ